MTDDDLIDRLQRAESAPYGKARSALLEDVVRRADAAQNEALAFHSRLSLVHSYVMGGEPRKSLVPFARCVAEWDAQPGKFQDHAYTFLWSFKYASSTLSKFPEVPLQQAYDVLDDMERRWREGGYSPQAVHKSRWLIASHIGDLETAAEQYRLWSTAPRDDLSDCVGCDPTSMARHLMRNGRNSEAVELAAGVLEGRLSCAEQPQQMLTVLLPAYVAEGMYSEAVDAHRRAYRALRSLPGELSSYSDHVKFCALTGNETRAIELIERHLPELAEPPSPHAEMHFAAAASLALRRVGDLSIRHQADDVPAAQLAEELAERALAIAARFDERNGTSHQSSGIQRVLDSEPWVEYLPLSETARRVHTRRQAAPPVRSAEAAVAEPSATGSGWLDVAEEAWNGERPDDATAAWQAFEREVPEADRTTLDRARLLDGLGLMSRDTPEAAIEKWSEALSLYAELGEEIRMLRDRARIARALGHLSRLDEALATGEEPLRRLIAEDEPRRRGNWQYSLATLYAQNGQLEDAVRELTAARARPETDATQQAHTAILLSNLLSDLDRLEEAESAATDGLAVEDEGARSMAYRLRGRIRIMLDRAAEAVDDLEEAIALSAVASGNEVYHSLCQVDLARAYLITGRSLEAAETAEEATAALSASPELLGFLLEARGVLIDAYRSLGELEPALTNVRAQLADSVDAHPHWIGSLRQDEGSLLERLDRDKEAVDAFLAAAELYDPAELPIDHVQVLRLAGQSARYCGDFDLVSQLLERALPILEPLPADDQAVLFQRAGIHWDLALLALQKGEPASAVREAQQSAEYYERGGFEGQLLNSRLLIAEHGTTDDVMLRELFTSIPTGDELWHRAGWLLVDRLQALGRADEAATVETQLQAQ